MLIAFRKIVKLLRNLLEGINFKSHLNLFFRIVKDRWKGKSSRCKLDSINENKKNSNMTQRICQNLIETFLVRLPSREFLMRDVVSSIKLSKKSTKIFWIRLTHTSTVPSTKSYPNLKYNVYSDDNLVFVNSLNNPEKYSKRKEEVLQREYNEWIDYDFDF